MRFKLDENLAASLSKAISEEGHNVETVYQEHLQGAPDDSIASACRGEDRILMTLDTDFSNIVAYPPENYPGMVVLRPRNQSATVVAGLIQEFLSALLHEDPKGALWIVEPGRIRISGKSA